MLNQKITHLLVRARTGGQMLIKEYRNSQHMDKTYVADRITVSFGHLLPECALWGVAA